jgi:hypothetical protein
MFFVQPSTPPPRMHQKLTKHGRFCKQNNQLPTKSHDELKDNSNIADNLESKTQKKPMRGSRAFSCNNLDENVK